MSVVKNSNIQKYMISLHYPQKKKRWEYYTGTLKLGIQNRLGAEEVGYDKIREKIPRSRAAATTGPEAQAREVPL